jgi:hypothetical protein
MAGFGVITDAPNSFLWRTHLPNNLKHHVVTRGPEVCLLMPEAPVYAAVIHPDDFHFAGERGDEAFQFRV